MKKFLVFFLVTILVLCAGVARGFNKENIELRFLDFDPYQTLAIPPQPLINRTFQLLIEVTNPTQTTIQVIEESVIPEMMQPDGTVVPLQRDEHQSSSDIPYCQLIEPHQRTYLYLKTILKLRANSPWRD